MGIEVATTLCPLCRRDNACGNLNTNTGTCWCQNDELKFSPSLLYKVPKNQRGKACVCQQCAREFQASDE